MAQRAARHDGSHGATDASEGAGGRACAEEHTGGPSGGERGAPAAGGMPASSAAPSSGDADRAAGARPAGRASPTATPARERVWSPPSLQIRCVEVLADHCGAIVDLRGVPAECVGALLFLVLKRGKLDYRLGRVFIDTGVPEVVEYFERNIDMLAGLSVPHGPATCRPDS